MLIYYRKNKKNYPSDSFVGGLGGVFLLDAAVDEEVDEVLLLKVQTKT